MLRKNNVKDAERLLLKSLTQLLAKFTKKNANNRPKLNKVSIQIYYKSIIQIFLFQLIESKLLCVIERTASMPLSSVSNLRLSSCMTKGQPWKQMLLHY